MEAAASAVKERPGVAITSMAITAAIAGKAVEIGAEVVGGKSPGRPSTGNEPGKAAPTVEVPPPQPKPAPAPETGTPPNSGQPPPSTYDYPRTKPVKKVREALDAHTTPEGLPKDGVTGEPITGPADYGHAPGFEYWRWRNIARKQCWSRQQWLEFWKDPNKWVKQSRYNNRSHKYELP